MNGTLRITSPANPLIKRLKTLHARKGRAETGLFLAEGARLASEAADLGVWPEIMAVSDAALERPQVRALTAAAGRARVKVVETTPAILAAVSRRDNPQTVIGAYRQRTTAPDDIPARPDALIVALDGVRDPGNFGTIMRTADAVGADAVALLGVTCDPFAVEAVRATMGSIFAVPLVRADFIAFDAWRRGRGLVMAGASLRGAAPHDAIPATGGVVVLMGNEQSGLDDTAEQACDALVKIPMRGRADSLNLAIATGVILYDVWRRRGYDGART